MSKIVPAICTGCAYISMVLKNDGTVWAWGWNIHGELGDGTYDGDGGYNNKLIIEKISASKEYDLHLISKAAPTQVIASSKKTFLNLIAQ